VGEPPTPAVAVTAIVVRGPELVDENLTVPAVVDPATVAPVTATFVCAEIRPVPAGQVQLYVNTGVPALPSTTAAETVPEPHTGTWAETP